MEKNTSDLTLQFVPAWVWPCSNVFVHHVGVKLVLVKKAFSTDLADARFLVVRKMYSQEVVLERK
jgi:hypothetical protein